MKSALQPSRIKPSPGWRVVDIHVSFTAVSTVMDKVLEEDLPWDHWHASQEENRLDHVLPQASARGGPRL